MEEFFQYLRFASVSADPARREELTRCALWLRGWLAGAGLEEARLFEIPNAPPAVYARTPILPGAQTLLLYGHYDVQPEGDPALWNSPPFEPHLCDGLVFARGATDNKGQTFALLLGLRELLRSGGPGLNVKILIEGAEEIGSPGFADLLAAHRELLACDTVLIADTSMIAPGRPAITNALRGILCAELVVRGPVRDLHSGMFGGAAPNPAQALCRILSRMSDAGGRVAIPGFADSVIPPDPEEEKGWETLPWDAEWFARAMGIAPSARREAQGTAALLRRVWAEPTAEINGLTSGHYGPGSKTIIPAAASAKLSFRLAPGQTVAGARRVLEDWFFTMLQESGLPGEFVFDHGGEPFIMPPSHPVLRAAREALREVFGKEPVLTREGLSIPAAVHCARQLGAPVLLTGLGLPDCGAHGPNESFPVEHLRLGAPLLRALAGHLPRALPAAGAGHH